MVPQGHFSYPDPFYVSVCFKHLRCESSLHTIKINITGIKVLVSCVKKSLGAFHSTKIPVWDFGHSTCPTERSCDSGCTDPTLATARLVIVLVSSIQKSGTWDDNYVNWKGTIGSDEQKWSNRSKWTTFKARPEYSGRTKPKWSVSCYVSTEISGILCVEWKARTFFTSCNIRNRPAMLVDRSENWTYWVLTTDQKLWVVW